MTKSYDVEQALADDEHAIDAETLEALKRDAIRYTNGGRMLFGCAILAGAALLAVSYHLTGVYVDDLNGAKDPQYMLVLLSVRSILWGGLSVGFLFGLFTVANAYIDQATRFRKRLYSAHMLNYAFRKFSDDIREGGRVEVKDLVELFSAWNANVDSAFSRVKFQKKPQNWYVGRDGMAVTDEPANTTNNNGGRGK